MMEKMPDNVNDDFQEESVCENWKLKPQKCSKQSLALLRFITIGQ